MITNGTKNNDRRSTQAVMVLREVLADVLRRGFYGTAAVEVSVQDGMIQSIRRKLDRLER